LIIISPEKRLELTTDYADLHGKKSLSPQNPQKGAEVSNSGILASKVWKFFHHGLHGKLSGIGILPRNSDE
jgi:hypothetical protein